jgi:ankyrin repeat protein
MRILTFAPQSNGVVSRQHSNPHSSPQFSGQSQLPADTLTLRHAAASNMAQPKFAGKKDQELHAAIEISDEVNIERLFKSGVDLNRVNSQKLTPLLTAVKFNQPKAISQLIALGANYNQTDSKNAVPMHHAAAGNKIEAARALLEGGAAVDPDSEWGTPMQCAALNGHTDMVNMLAKEFKGNVNFPSRYNGYTPLHAAAHKGRFKTAEALLALGALRTNKSTEDILPFQLAAAGGHTDLVRLLAQGVDVDQRIRKKDMTTNSALLSAAEGGHDDTVRVLVKELDADIDQEYYGNTALHYASGKGHTSTVKTLLELGAKAHLPNGKGKTAYKIAKNGEIKQLLKQAMEKDASSK